MNKESRLTIPHNLSQEDNNDDPCASDSDIESDSLLSRLLVEKIMVSKNPDDRRLLAMIVPKTSARAQIYEEQKMAQDESC